MTEEEKAARLLLIKQRHAFLNLNRIKKVLTNLQVEDEDEQDEPLDPELIPEVETDEDDETVLATRTEVSTGYSVEDLVDSETNNE